MTGDEGVSILFQRGFVSLGGSTADGNIFGCQIELEGGDPRVRFAVEMGGLVFRHHPDFRHLHGRTSVFDDELSAHIVNKTTVIIARAPQMNPNQKFRVA
jgi:hypothetical protein